MEDVRSVREWAGGARSRGASVLRTQREELRGWGLGHTGREPLQMLSPGGSFRQETGGRAQRPSTGKEVQAQRPGRG